MASTFPIPAFNFKVEIEGDSFLFSEVNGLKITTEFQEVRSGGLNNMHFKIPTKLTFGEVTMKRGIFSNQADKDKSSKDLFDALKKRIDLDQPKIFTGTQFKDINITLVTDAMDANVCKWTLLNPALVSWELSSLAASNNDIAFETLVFQCSGMKVNYT